jgi:hypothetical protein
MFKSLSFSTLRIPRVSLPFLAVSESQWVMIGRMLGITSFSTLLPTWPIIHSTLAPHLNLNVMYHPVLFSNEVAGFLAKLQANQGGIANEIVPSMAFCLILSLFSILCGGKFGETVTRFMLKRGSLMGTPSA